MKIANLTSIGAVNTRSKSSHFSAVERSIDRCLFGKKKAIWADYIYKLWTLFDTWTRVY